MAKTWDPSEDILADPRARSRRDTPQYPEVVATAGLALHHRASRFGGVLVRFGPDAVEIRRRDGAVRVFRATPGGFQVAGRAVTLVRAPVPVAGDQPARTASGSVALTGQRARVAQASRILVEGVHDAALVERVWGDDLRVEGIVVERLDGIDHLPAVIARFDPGPARRLGVLVDHLVPGSKEARLAAAVTHPDVLVTGTPFVDVWQAIRPAVLGIPAWPAVPKGHDWKTEVCRRLGFPAPPETWRRILAAVGTFADLEPALVGAVERLIDFVSAPPAELPWPASLGPM
ncbi:MAG TPA: DUF3097 family protein [Acidimicrobiales bacterium]|jgi:hypothetical protein|nr:DUF3097 family protein [Acidimicrobiales bacterium]